MLLYQGIFMMNRTFHRLFLFSLCCLLIVSALGCGGKGGSLAQALKLMEADACADAIPLLEAASISTPGSATVWCNLGVCYLQAGKAEEAIRALRKGVDLASGKPEAYEYLGRAYLAAGQYNDARDILVTANTIGPGSPRILTALGVVEMKAGNMKPSFSYTMEALDFDDGYAPALYNMAVLYRDKVKNKNLAERFFRRFLSAAPSDPRAEEARGFLSPEEASNDGPAKGLVEKAKRDIENEDYDGALVALKEALIKDPGYEEAVWHMATLSDHVLNDPLKALRYYSDFKSKFPNDKRSQQAGRKCEEIRATLAQAERVKKETAKSDDLAFDPEQVAEAQDALDAGCKWQQKGDAAKAESFYRRAIELDARMATAYNNLGILYLASENFEGAKTALSTALQLNPDYVDSLYMLARAQHDTGDQVRAVKNLNSVLLKRPDFAKAHYLLGVILNEEKQLEAAKIHFERYAQLADKDVR